MSGIPRDGSLEREPPRTPQQERPARGVRAEKLVEGAVSPAHADTHEGGSDPITPSGISAAEEIHGHEITTDVLLSPKIVDGDGATLVPVGSWPVTLTGNTDTVYFVWRVPTEWRSFASIGVVMIPDAAEEIQMDIDVAVSAEGEQYDASERQLLNETKTIAAGDVDDLVEWDILNIGPMFAGIGIGDYVTVKLTSDIDGLVIVGLHISYAAGGASGGGGGVSHPAVTLDADADAFLSLTVQRLGLDTQAANTVAAGPAAGGAAIPTFRALVAADVPAHDYDIHTGGVPFAELEYDDGTSDPLIDGVADDGVEDSAARKDHVHPKHHDELHEPESHLSTDITGAELETLSDTSDADALHDHATHTLKDGTRPFTGTVAGITPTAGSHLATKNYVDEAVHFISEYYLNNTGSGIGGYFKMLDTPTGEGESTFVTAALGAGDDQLLDVWATDPTVPGVTVMEAGVYSAHIHVQRTGGNRNFFLYFEIYSRTHPGGAETLRVTSELSREITDNNKAGISLHGTLATEVVIASTDRLVIKWYANLGVGAATEITLFAEGENNTRVSLPISTEVLNQVYLRQDGTKVGAVSQAQDFSSGLISGDVVKSDADAADDLGATTKRWKDIYFSGDLKDDTTSLSVADLKGPRRTLVLMAQGGNGTTTSGCDGPTQAETGSTVKNYWHLSFAANEKAFWQLVMPDNWDGDTTVMTAQFMWLGASGHSSSDTVIWGIQAVDIGNDEVMTGAFGTQRTVTDTVITAGRLHISDATALSFWPADPDEGELCIIEVERTGGTMTEEALLLAVHITYTTNAYEDAT